MSDIAIPQDVANAAPKATQAPAQGAPEYTLAMANKARTARGEEPLTALPEGGLSAPVPATAPPQKPERPADVPEKFWDAEKGQVRVDDLLKSYKSLESTRGQKPADVPPAPEGAPPAAPPATAEPDDAAKTAAEAAGLDWNGLVTKVGAKGTIEDTDYAALEKIGIPRAMVDDYLGLVGYRREQETTAALTYMGGEKAANDLMAWAATNLSAPEIETYNGMLSSPNWKTAVDVLKAKHAAVRKGAGEPSLVVADQGSKTATGYRSRDEMKRDMRDPRYATDPIFRDQVVQRMKFRTYDLD